MSTLNEDLPETESWAARMFAANAATEPVSGGYEDSVRGAGRLRHRIRRLVPSRSHRVASAHRRLPLALLAGAGVALIGGLVWAAVVITTHYDIGFLAWFVGAASGVAIARASSAPVAPPVRVLAGVFAAGGIVVGKYVIFVHAIKKALDTLLAGQGHSVGYLDPHAMSVFVHNFGSIVRPVYALWVALAFIAAVRTSGGKAIYTRRHR